MKLDPRIILADPHAYAAVQRGFGAARARNRFATRFLRPVAGDRVLDIGCGTGDILDVLPAVTYIGFDLSAEYVAAARERYGPRGTFHQADVLDVDLSGEQPFDLVIATGVIHHLDDERAGRLIALSASLLRHAGRLVTWDGTFVEGQSRVARWLLERDRGEHIRTPEAYDALAARHFADVRHHLVSDFLRVPYTHCVIDATAPRRGGLPAT